ncbi:MAG: hypothetical protein ACREPM_19105 [Gemmatimonadaceae bacterium]
MTTPDGVSLESGGAIRNARGAAGSVGFLAVRLDTGGAVLVTTHHVAFGNGGAAAEPVWLADTHSGRARRVGRAAYGREGTVRSRDGDVWIDAAVVDLDDGLLRAADCALAASSAADHDSLIVAAGDVVTAIGAASGLAEGRVVDIAFDDRIRVGGRMRNAPRQLLVRSAVRGHPFMRGGDSGAALRNARGTIVGLLWGTTPRGDGIACPIAPVLEILHVRAATVTPGPVPRRARAS